jgi:hypothetical protein
MKKIFTLVLSTLFVSAAFAQYDNADWNRYNYHPYQPQADAYAYSNNNYFYYNGNRYYMDQRDEVIRQVSANYDFRIQQVANDWYMSPWQKRNAIDNLKDQKERDINSIYSQCNEQSYSGKEWKHRRHHHDDDD